MKNETTEQETERRGTSELTRLLAEQGQKYVFEVLDYTNDEMYYPLGIFPSLQSAGAYIDELDQPHKAISWWQDDEYEKIVVKKRRFGWSENGKQVLEIKRQQYYNEETDEYLWKRLGG